MDEALEFEESESRKDYMLAIRPDVDLFGELRGWENCNGLIYRCNGVFNEISHKFLNRFFDREGIDQVGFYSSYKLKALGDFFANSNSGVESLGSYVSNNLFPFRTKTDQQAREIIRELKDNPHMYASIEMQKVFSNLIPF